MFRSILVPLDGSAFTEQALPWALCLARRSGAKLDLVRGQVHSAVLQPAATWGRSDPDLDAECQQEQLYLDETRHTLADVAPVAMSTTVVPGLEADGILQRVREVGADLVVMTTNGRSTIGRFVLGSMADQLVRRSGVPVLLVHTSEMVSSLRPEPVPQRLLIPLDGSSLAEQVLDPAVKLARLVEIPCTLLRVAEADADPVAVSYLEAIASRLRAQGLAVEARVLPGQNADEAILGQARCHDLIALATHGRGGVARILVGHTAERLIRAAPCPVLAYRSASQADFSNAGRPGSWSAASRGSRWPATRETSCAGAPHSARDSDQPSNERRSLPRRSGFTGPNN